MKPGELVLVDWVDAHSDGQWQSRTDAARLARDDGMNVQTVGWVVEETDDFLLVASSQTNARQDGALVTGTMMIPQVTVRTVTRLQVGRAVAR